MGMRRTGMVVVGCCWLVGAAAAEAQVIQLPTYRVFGTSTTVSVPDRGQAHVGSVSSARSGQSSRGLPLVGNLPGAGPLFRNRSVGAQLGYAGSNVHVSVIDLEEMDRAVLAEAERRRAVARSSDSARSPRWETSVTDPPPAPETMVIDPDQLISLGRQAKGRGDYRLATAYFDMASKISIEMTQKLKRQSVDQK